MNRTGLVVGASGIIGSHAARELIAEGWTVHGLARQPRDDVKGLRPVAADLLDPASLEAALARVDPTHVFLTSWMRNATEAENIRVNGAMVRNLLQALAPKRSVRHVALVTGLKHYLGPFDRYAQEGSLPETPLREEQPRLDVENFYYAQEDEVYAAAARDGFSWTVHRPHTVIGKAVGNLMNMGTTLAVYASICKATGRPFRWPGSGAQWQGITDMTDARVLAKHLVWASTTEAAWNEAFNVVNGDIFRWNWLWPRLARWFDVEPIGFEGTVHPLERRNGGRRPAVARDRAAPRPGRAGAGQARLRLAHRPGSGSPDRGHDRHVEEPEAGLHRVPAYRRIIFRSVRAIARGPADPF